MWRYPAQAAWYFVYVPEEISRPIRKKFPAGFVPIQATVGKTIWQTSLFPSKEEVYLISIKALVRKQEDIFDGDQIEVKFLLK